MSSSSNAVREDFVLNDPSEERRGLARFLAGIAHECSALGGEISSVGDALADSITVAPGAAGVIAFQSFDALAQNAHAQAKLIAHLSRLVLLGRGGSVAEFLAQIDDIPLPAVQRRMKLAIGASVGIPPTCRDEEISFWLEDAGCLLDAGTTE